MIQICIRVAPDNAWWAGECPPLPAVWGASKPPSVPGRCLGVSGDVETGRCCGFWSQGGFPELCWLPGGCVWAGRVLLTVDLPFPADPRACCFPGRGPWVGEGRGAPSASPKVAALSIPPSEGRRGPGIDLGVAGEGAVCFCRKLGSTGAQGQVESGALLLQLSKLELSVC